MTIAFHKYQGTGNDFIMIDNRTEVFPKADTKLIERLCDRKFGIGADGLILLENDPVQDFKMVYYNSDGNESSMCGNGGRCLVAFAKSLGVIDVETTFDATDGLHFATVYENDMVSLQMKDVDAITVTPDYVFLDTGSPHHVEVVDSVAATDVAGRGAKVRYSDLYGQRGSNVNFVEQEGDAVFKVRTYERGVEDETLSCGTGVTAVAIAMRSLGKTHADEVTLNVPGGQLQVSFFVNDGVYSNVFLKGPATFVFKGEIAI
ncbi:diaminopimelate epimerase [Flavobacterium sp.]|uniref:diaminopimelate epimerase n=1 Tax=Flavobacterium sp. TaxID=239 RepID=UPI00262E12AD|nr:diaminopimelate epimerase [Flavobacterium sp.]